MKHRELVLFVEHREADETPVVRAIAEVDLDEALAEAIFGVSLRELDVDQRDELHRCYLPEMREKGCVTFEGDPPLSLRRVEDVAAPYQDWLAAKNYLELHEVGARTVRGGVERIFSERARATHPLVRAAQLIAEETPEAAEAMGAPLLRAVEARRRGDDEQVREATRDAMREIRVLVDASARTSVLLTLQRRLAAHLPKERG